MAITYTDLKAQLLQFTRDDDPVNSVPLHDTIIAESEDFLSSVMSTVRQLRQSATITLVATQPYVPLPANFRSVEHWTLTVPGNRTHVLQARPAQFIELIYPFLSQTSRPAYYAIWNQSNFRVAPVPDINYSTVLNYLAKWQHLGPTQATTDLSTDFPELLRIACLSHFEVMRRFPEQRADYDERLKTLLTAAGVVDTAQRRDAMGAHMGGASA